MNDRSIKVLLIDDDEDDYILTRELFSLVKGDAYALEWAPSYEAGLKIVQRCEHDVCLVDYSLGARNGVELIREAREARVTTPMILLTGSGSHELDLAAMMAGATDYLIKNETSPARLERTVRYAVQLNLERHRVEAELGSFAQHHAAIAEIGRLALAGGPLNSLFAEVTAIVARTMKVEFCRLLELTSDGEAQTLTLRGGTGWKPGVRVDQTVIPTGLDSLSGFALTQDQPVVVEDLTRESRFKDKLLTRHRVRSGISVVIRGPNGPYGVLGAHSKAPRKFSPEEVNFLVAATNVLSEAISRKQAEEQLRTSEARFRRVVESNVFGIFFSDAGGKISSANDAFLNMVGYDRGDLDRGEVDWSVMSPPEYAEVDAKAFNQILATGLCDTYEKEFIRKDGSRISILVSVATFDGPEQGGGVVFVLDNSDRKRAEESLKQSETWLDAIFDSSRDSIAVEEDFQLVYANKAFSHLFGYESAEAVVGKEISSFCAVEDEQKLRDFALRRVVGEEAPTMYEFKGLRKDSTLFDVEVSVSSFQSKGRTFVVSTLRDITERKRVTAGLHESERAQREIATQLEAERARLVAAQAVAKVGSWETDLTTMKVTWSAETYRIFETSPDEFHETHAEFMEFVHPDDRVRVDEAFVGSIGQRNLLSLEHRLLLRDGRITFVEQRWQVFYDELGEPTRAVGTCQDISERKESEIAIERTLERLNDAQRIGQIGDWKWDIATQEISWSAQVFAIFGLDPGKGPPRNYEEYAALHDLESRRRLQQKITQAIFSGEAQHYELALVRPDGERITVQSMAIPRKDEAGKVLGLYGTIQDITERRKVEDEVSRASESLRESEERYRELVENATDIIYTLDRKGNYTSINKAGERILGYTRDESLTRKITQSVVPELREYASQILHDQLAGKDIPAFEMEVIAKDGHKVTLEVNTIINREKGKNVGVQGIARDITERKRMERDRSRLMLELESEKARLAAIFTNAPAFIASLRGPQHVFELVNSAFFNLVGPRAVAGKTVREVFPDLSHQGFFELLDHVYATGVAFVGEEMEITLAGAADTPGPPRYINFVYHPLKEIDGKVSGIICHGVEVTEQVLSRRRLQESEDRLRQSQKLESVGMLAGGIAHDFNNLLTVITGYSELAAKRADCSETMINHLEEIKKASARAAGLTRQLLAFSRRQVLQPKILDLNAVILNISKMVRRLVGEDMDLCIVAGPELGSVKADPGQIEQVILNLAINARDSMPEGGKITIETTNIDLDTEFAATHTAMSPGWHVLLNITDTGVGMDEETLGHIFEPFFTTKDQGKGTGLGLATVYGIVKQSGGSIWVSSEVNVGTTVSIYLPIVDEPLSLSSIDSICLEDVCGPATILLVEDDDLVRRIARETLVSYKYEVLEASNAGDALRICGQHAGVIDLLLTDVVMPRMNGMELADRLSLMRPATRVLFMSGYTEHAAFRNGIFEGEAAFIQKPFTPQSLALKVGGVLRQAIPARSSTEVSTTPR